MANEPEFLSVEQVAALLVVSEKTIYRAIRRGELAAMKAGRVYRIGRDSFADWVARKTVAGPAVQPAMAPPAAPAEVGSLKRLREIEGEAA